MSEDVQQRYEVPLPSDNAPELISHKLVARVEGHYAELVFVKPGKPAHNA